MLSVMEVQISCWCAVGTDEDALLGLNFGAYSVRLTGQDVERGTFNHRHAVLYDQRTAARCSYVHGTLRSDLTCARQIAHAHSWFGF